MKDLCWIELPASKHPKIPHQKIAAAHLALLLDDLVEGLPRLDARGERDGRSDQRQGLGLGDPILGNWNSHSHGSGERGRLLLAEIRLKRG